jgi:15-cis-phytoene synthase
LAIHVERAAAIQSLVESPTVLTPADFEALRAAARHDEPDRYLSALLAREPQRTGLLVIAAFSAELRRIPSLVSDPMIGEIRLQWWRDAIAAFDQHTKTGNPVADALADTVRIFDLPPALLLAMTEARAFDLYTDPMPDADALNGYLAKTEGVPFELAFRVMAGHAPVGTDVALLASTGRCYGLSRLIGNLPHHLARGCCPLPVAMLDDANLSLDTLLAGEHTTAAISLIENLCREVRAMYAALRPPVAHWPRGYRLAVLPIAVVPAYVQAAWPQKRHPWRQPAEVAPLARVWRIAYGALTGRP